MYLSLDFDKEEKIHSKIIESNKALHWKYPYYSDILYQTNFFETKKMPTVGVNVSTKGFNYYYNPDFIEILKPTEINFINIHEIMHLLCNHPKRGKNCDHRLANIAADMIINSTITETIDKDFISTPEIDGKNMVLFIPKEYNGEPIFEKLYNFLLEKKEEFQNQKNKDDEDKQDENGEGKKSNSYGPNGKNGEMQSSLKDILDEKIITIGINEDGTSLDVHISDEVPKEIRDQLIKDVIERIKARGLSSSDFETVLQRLRKSKKDYLKEIKSGLEQMMGRNKYKTWSRTNRRELPFKGYKKIGSRINVILDTSGSMNGNFEKALSYVFNRDIVINLIQCDVKVQSIHVIKDMKQLKKEKIKGLGGTTLQPSIDYVKNNFNNFNTLILTDGYCENLDVSELKKQILVLTSDINIPIEKSNNRIKQIIVKEDEK